jgi:hypothetical protein
MEPQSNADELNLRGTGRLALGDVAGAIADYDEALRASPRARAGQIYCNRGTARHIAGNVPRRAGGFQPGH